MIIFGGESRIFEGGGVAVNRYIYFIFYLHLPRAVSSTGFSRPDEREARGREARGMRQCPEYLHWLTILMCLSFILGSLGGLATQSINLELFDNLFQTPI